MMSTATATATRPIESISRNDFQASITEHCKRGAQPFAAVVSVEPSNMVKTNKTTGQTNPYWKQHKAGTLRKLSYIGGMVIASNWYEASVNRQRTREGSEAGFEVQEPKWKWVKIDGSPFATYQPKGSDVLKTYLIVKIQKVHSAIFVLDGVPLPDADQQILWTFMPTHSNADHQGVDTEIIFRLYTFSNIRQMSISGHRYEPAAETTHYSETVAFKAWKAWRE